MLCLCRITAPSHIWQVAATYVALTISFSLKKKTTQNPNKLHSLLILTRSEASDHHLISTKKYVH